MRSRTFLRTTTIAGLITGGGYWLWRALQRQHGTDIRAAPEDAHQLLTRVAPLLRLPPSPNHTPEVLPDGSGLRCPITGRIYPYRNGVLDVLENELDLTETQHLLNTPLTAWIYDRFRGSLMKLFGLPDFPIEVAAIQRALQARPGDTILDIACGHGNFTVEWAKRVGPEGLVIGLDISPAMLSRAAQHVRNWGVTNILLIRGDAHHLPLADGGIEKVNSSGGFHQLPDLPQALREIARVSTPDAILTASTFAEGPDDLWTSVKQWLKQRFAFHFVPLIGLGDQLDAVGYRDYHWALPGGWFGYISARKRNTTAIDTAR